jgi:hypothetical protein
MKSHTFSQREFPPEESFGNLAVDVFAYAEKFSQTQAPKEKPTRVLSVIRRTKGEKNVKSQEEKPALEKKDSKEVSDLKSVISLFIKGMYLPHLPKEDEYEEREHQRKEYGDMVYAASSWETYKKEFIDTPVKEIMTEYKKLSDEDKAVIEPEIQFIKALFSWEGVMGALDTGEVNKANLAKTITHLMEAKEKNARSPFPEELPTATIDLGLADALRLGRVVGVLPDDSAIKRLENQLYRDVITYAGDSHGVVSESRAIYVLNAAGVGSIFMHATPFQDQVNTLKREDIIQVDVAGDRYIKTGHQVGLEAIAAQVEDKKPLYSNELMDAYTVMGEKESDALTVAERKKVLKIAKMQLGALYK